MTDLTPNHPAVRAANMGVQEWLAGDGPFDDDPVRLAHDMTAACITAALPHLTADDLPTRLVRDIQARTIRATARAVTYEEDDTPQGHDWDRAAVAAWLNELADNIEEEADA